jgi:pantetheine-phosphate adenylyltransferase
MARGERPIRASELRKIVAYLGIPPPLGLQREKAHQDRQHLVSTQIGFYPGTFDPVTHGHTDVIRRCACLLDRLVIGIGVNPGKAPMFTADERIAMLEREVAPIARETRTDIRVMTFSGLAITAAQDNGASVMIRGIRDGTDFDYEMQMAGMNGEMAPDIQTIYVAASPAVRHIAANLVRAIALMGGDASPFVSKDVLKQLKSKLAKRA